VCGILGTIGAVDPAVFDRALDTLTHRGPDGRGVHRHGAVTLGHRRLSVIDPRGGAQPMLDAERDLSIVFNGEIYNHLELRAELATHGFRFQTTSDTETLLAMYAHYGRACVPRLRGMFAFVLHDARTGMVFGARDPFGKKPLYWRSVGGATPILAFASEPRALLALRPGEHARASIPGIVSFLQHDYVTGVHSAYEGIQRVAPGHTFVIDLRTFAPGAPVESTRYWSAAATLRTRAPAVSEGEAVAKLQALIDRAVERRLLSDVPLGVLLSGGVDSSIVAALAARHTLHGKLKSFSIGFRDPRFDESRYAEEVAASVGTTHRCKFFGPEDLLASVDIVLRRLDEPFADPSVLPTAMLCEFAREDVTVALGGDGGDELFAGYDTFAALRPAALSRRMVPAFMDAMMDSGVGMLGTDSATTHMPLEFKVRRFLKGHRLRGGAMVRAWQGPFDSVGLDRLLPDIAWRDTVDADLDPLPSSAPESSAMLHWYQTVYLPDDILVKGDRASMLHSLELRSPFLDVDVANYVNALPFAMKLRGRTRKHLLREAIRGWQRDGMSLPDHVLSRPKKGFGVPIATWLRGPLREQLTTTLLDAWPGSLGVVSRPERARLIDEHLSGARNVWKELWSLMALARWADTWIEQT
jgi:asparagine synthase (glutamine-hydrolysing)